LLWLALCEWCLAEREDEATSRVVHRLPLQHQHCHIAKDSVGVVHACRRRWRGIVEPSTGLHRGFEFGMSVGTWLVGGLLLLPHG